MKYEDERLGVERRGDGEVCEDGERTGGEDGLSDGCDMSGD